MTLFSEKNRRRIRRFVSYYRPYRATFALDMALAVISAVLMLIIPLVSGRITGEVLTGWNDSTLHALICAAAILLALVIARTACVICYGWIGHAMGARMEGDMRRELFRHYETLSFNFFSHESVGQLMTIMSNDLNGMTELFHHGPEDIVMTLIKFTGAFVVLINIDWRLTLIVFGAFPLLFFCAVKANALLKNRLLDSKRELGNLNATLEDCLSGIRTVKAFGNEKFEYDHFSAANDSYTNTRCRFYRAESMFYDMVSAYPQLLTVIVIIAGALFVGRGQLDIGVMVTFLLYVSCICEPIQTFFNFVRLYQEGTTSFRRFMDMMERTPDVCEQPEPVSPDSCAGNISMDDVSFRYESDGADVLSHVSLEITGGERVAIVGVSGIGKTTLVSLIARFYDPTAGCVRLDGRDMRTLSFDALRRSIGIVQQEAFIFNGTVAENIRYGRPDASDEEVHAAARMANADGFISALKGGYDAVVGTRGIMLSGGQRQRISLARIFLKDPAIVMLDEATSALDYESEMYIQSSLEQLMHGRTSVTIAHRLSTIQNADRIVVMGEGGIVEQGTHEQLMAHNGEYARLYSIRRSAG